MKRHLKTARMACSLFYSSFCISENLNVFSPAGSSSPADMECGGGELSDSGSSGYWSWDHGSVSPAPSPCVTEVDSSPDEGLHMELDPGEELNAKKPTVPRYVPLNYLLEPYRAFSVCIPTLGLFRSLFSVPASLLCFTCAMFSFSQSCLRGVYKCLWPSCGKVLTSSVGIKRHIRVLHLG